MKRFLLLLLFLYTLGAARAQGQTEVVRGLVDPATCDPNRGLIFYNVTTQQMKSCTALNTWTQFSPSSGGTPAPPVNFLQLNNAGAFGPSGESDDGSTMTVSRDQANCGPNPVFDIRCFGAYFSISPPTTTGSINSGSPTLTINAAGDYANGQGIVVHQAGALPTITTPGTPIVTSNLLNGATTWNYEVVAEDYKGGLTAASVAGTTTTGPAALGQVTVGISSVTITNGVATYTTVANHNLAPGLTVVVCGFGGVCGTLASKTDGISGAKTVSSTPSGTTFTTNEGTAYNNPTNSRTVTPPGGQAFVEVLSSNTLRYASAAYSGVGTLRYWIYRSQGAGAFALAGIAIGLDPYFVDAGGTAPTPPAYVPTGTPNASAQAGYLATTILGGGGTTTLTLNANAGTTVSGQTVLHDNTPAVLAAGVAAAGQTGGTVYIPSTPNNGANSTAWLFNSLLNFGGVPQGSNGANFTVFIAGTVGLGQPWIPRNNMKFEGMPKRNQAFQYFGGSVIGGGSIPLLYGQPTTSVLFKNLYINPFNAQGTAVYFDNDNAGNGSAGLTFEKTSVAVSGNFGRPLIIKGGFGFYFRDFACISGNITNDLPPPCIEFPDSSIATGASTSQISGNVSFVDSFFINTGAQWNAFANNSSDAPGGFYFVRTLMESGRTPLVRVASITQLTNDITFTGSSIADSVVGLDTPFVDASNSNVTGVQFTGGQGDGGSPPLLIVGNNSSPASLTVNYPTSGNYGNAPWFVQGPQNLDINNQPLSLRGANGRVGYAMAVPGVPSGCVVSAGGSETVGTLAYSVVAVDFDGVESVIGPFVQATTSPGNQTVTCNLPALPAGAKGFNIYKNLNATPQNGGSKIFVSSCPVPQFTGTTFVDNNSSNCGANPSNTSADSVILSSNGITTPAFHLMGTGVFAVTNPSPTLTANRTQTDPDATGTYLLDTTGLNILGAAPIFDNFNRVNGAIGGNYTSPQGSWQVTGNTATVSTNSNNITLYTASPVASNDMWAEVQITAFPNLAEGPIARMSGTVDALLQGYACAEFAGGPNISVYRYNNSNNPTSLGSQAVTTTVGDVVRIEVIGTTINCYQNGILVLNVTDSGVTGTGSSFAGMLENVTGGVPGGLDNLFFGPIPTPLVSPRLENSFRVPVHAQTITVGPTAPIAGPLAGGTLYANNVLINALPATVTVASGTAAMPTSAIASGVCSTVVTVVATGVATTDTIQSTFNGDPTATTGYAPTTGGTLYIYAYPTAGNVNYKLCNNTSASITPGAATLNFRVVR